MKAKDLKELTKEELLKKRRDLKEEMFNLRFQHSTGQLENTARMKILRKDVARLDTVLRQQEIQAQATR